MAYLPFGMTPFPVLGPTVPVINDKTPAPTLQNLAAYVATPVLTAVGANVLFTTAPDRGRFFPVAIWFSPSLNTGISATPTIRIGYTNSGTVYSDWVASNTFLSSLLDGQFFEIPLKADAGGAAPTGRYSAPPSTPIVMYVSSAGVAPCAGFVTVEGFYA